MNSGDFHICKEVFPYIYFWWIVHFVDDVKGLGIYYTSEGLL